MAPNTKFPTHSAAAAQRPARRGSPCSDSSRSAWRSRACSSASRPRARAPKSCAPPAQSARHPLGAGRRAAAHRASPPNTAPVTVGAICRPSGRSLRACPRPPCWGCRGRTPGQSASVGPAPARSWAGAPNLPASRAPSTPRLKGAIGLPVRISLLPPIRRTLADYNLFNIFATQDASRLLKKSSSAASQRYQYSAGCIIDLGV